jgi:hypothetical protein
MVRTNTLTLLTPPHLPLGIKTARFVHADNVQRTNETLIRHGYIGSSPEKISLAFPLHLFEIYRQIHRVCPRYSLGALSRTLTNLAQVQTYYYICLFLTFGLVFRLRVALTWRSSCQTRMTRT